MSQPSRKVTEAQRRQIRQLVGQGLTPKAIAERTCIDGRIVSGIVSKMRDTRSIPGPVSRPKPGNSRVKRADPGSRVPSCSVSLPGPGSTSLPVYLLRLD